MYEHYEIVEEDGEPFVVAPIEPLVQQGPAGGREVWAGGKKYIQRTHVPRDPREGVMNWYAPLQTPELVLDLAELAERPVTPEAVRDWALVYGLLGLSGEDTLTVGKTLTFSYKGQGRRGNVRAFADEALDVRACLRTFEAVSDPGDVETAEMLDAASTLPRKAFEPFGAKEWHAGKERPWLLHVLGRLVGMRLLEHARPRFRTHTRDGVANGGFSLAWGFEGLIGAIWLQMAWLLEAGSEAPRCKLPDCRRVIHFEPGVPAVDLDSSLPRHARGKYKTRKDRKFCKGRGHRQTYNHRKKAGWPGYH